MDKCPTCKEEYSKSTGDLCSNFFHCCRDCKWCDGEKISSCISCEIKEASLSSSRRYHISSDASRDSKTMLLVPKILSEKEAVEVIRFLHSKDEKEEDALLRFKSLEVGQYMVGRNFGILFRVADAE